ncbi:DUF943 family protein [Rahnella ecdela]|uniref:DUF943 family protein n=1 Tax=Rahnella ecdela TaxID=2816250 RepID=A0ABS6LHD1_9GAMM|nr:DUF943 family protein [Rahnella ecdela]MBU9846341.1 DUF943 family protein [Rahnella ecdela]
MSKKNITVCVLLAALFIFRLITRNPEIIHVDQDVGAMVIVVKQPPLTQEGKIIWWEVHEGAIKKKYGLPKPEENGVYYISVTDGGNGFKKVSQDNSNWFSFSNRKLYCFDEVKSEERCLEYNDIMTIIHDENNKISYLIGNDQIVK